MSNYNPYAPPQHDSNALGHVVGGVASWDGNLLTIPKQFSFPRVCLKCSSPEVMSRRTQKFAFTPLWARLLIVVCTPGALVAMLMTTKRATLELPLCDACHARWKKARLLNVMLLVAMLVGIFGMTLAGPALGGEAAGFVILSTILVLVVGLAIVMRKVVIPRTLQAKKIDDQLVTLVGVDPRAGEQVARGSA